MTLNYLGKLIFCHLRLVVILLSAGIVVLSGVVASSAQLRLEAMFAGVAASTPSLIHKVHVFGKDDRIELPEKYRHLRGKIGLLYNSTIKYGCTATCVAPDVILTAAHCVLQTAKKKRFPDTTGLKFFLWSSRLPEVRIGTDVLYSRDLIPRNVVAGFPISKKFRGSNFKQDWAFIKLRRKICDGNSIQLKSVTDVEMVEAANSGKLVEVGFHGDRDFGEKLLWTNKCAIKGVKSRKKNPKTSQKSQTIHHTCDMFKGSSGAPLMIETVEGPAIVAVNVAEFYHQKYLKRGRKIIKRYQKKALYNIAVSVSAFSKYFPLMAWNHISPYNFQLLEIQQRLKDMKLYQGEMDGIFGPATWRAIREFEKTKNRIVLGLPTTDIRDALRAEIKLE